MATRTRFRLTKGVIHGCIATSVALGVLFMVVMHEFWINLPNIDNTEAFAPQQSTRITDRNGHELYRIIGTQDRTWIPIESIPLHVQQAFIAIEDKRFYGRPCIDLQAMGRAALANIGNFGREGGSTITQQLVRTIFLNQEKSIDRKIREAMLACQLESRRSKKEILELYLNWIAFGHGVSGIEQASQFYFGMSAVNLSVAQAATLAALPQRPTYLSPYGPQKSVSVSDTLRKKLRAGTIVSAADLDPNDLKPGLLGRRTRVGKRPFILEGRANEVIRKMHEQGLISVQHAAQAHNEIVELQFAEQGYRIVAPHFVFWVRSTFPSQMPANIQTTLDVQYQQLAQYSIAKHYNTLLEHGAEHVALLALDAKTNEILAYIGNVGYFSDSAGQVDMVQAPRQPGSSFKPFVYAAAFANGHLPTERIVDEPIWLGRYKPKNFDGGFLWRMSMAEALAKSRNIPAIKAYYLAGQEDPIIRLAAALGAKTPFATKATAVRTQKRFSFGWPLALGAAETPLFEMVHAYSTLANKGIYRPIRSILSVPITEKQYYVLPPSVAESVTDALRKPENRPEGYWRDAMEMPGIPAAIKTGTSNTAWYPRDVWTIGYTDKIIVGVWVGNANGTPLQPEANGLTVALPIWTDFVQYAHRLIVD